MTRLAVVGSLNADLTLLVDHLPEPGETVVATSPALVSCGGKGGNQAAAAAAFGAAVTMVGKVGDDQQGWQLLADLAARGVDASGVIVASGARTGGATIAVDGDGENLILVDPGANSLLSPDEVEAADLGAADAVIVQLEIPLPAVAAAMSAAGGGIRLLNPAPAPATALPAALLRVAGVLVPNLAELARLTGDAGPAGLPSEADLTAVARLARSLAGTADVVVTLGSGGALVVRRSAATSVHVPAPPVATVDTTGAGDCFCGTLAASLAERLDLTDAARLSVAAAALSTTAYGARGNLAGRAAAEHLADTLSVQVVGG
ncbi:MAG TPA: PfkB family carbohydrate kinase [Streptosporangiaceae bacterium]|nr:PfkB family carbohydrate kinase [Streptosporangiaceae bacterium]